MKPSYSFKRGTTPLLVSIPHAGVLVPRSINDRLTSKARHVPDTDWFVDRVYQWVVEQGGGLLIANYSRYVVDLNRPPDDAALYENVGTGLLPEQTFDGKALYRRGLQPDRKEAQERLRQYWKPYHEKLSTELKALKYRFGHAVLLDAHSILSKVPGLFDGTLPDLNLGSFQGASADPGLVSACMAVLGADPHFSLVLDGRFKGGYITRNYGSPGNGIHALQLEMAQSTYMVEEPPAYNEKRAEKLMPVLQNFVDTLIKWTPAGE